MPRIKYALLGHRFEMLLVTGWKDGKWVCLCDCGNERLNSGWQLTNRKSTSCGCAVSAKAKQQNTKHGISHTPLGTSWYGLMQRCFNPKSTGFEHWGGRGIFPCDFIKASPVNLLFSIGDRPDAKSIDRIKNDLGYYCGNCAQCIQNKWPLNIKWSDDTEQRRNTSRTRLVTIEGKTKTASQWAYTFGLDRGEFHRLFCRGIEKGKVVEITLSQLSARLKLPHKDLLDLMVTV